MKEMKIHQNYTKLWSQGCSWVVTVDKKTRMRLEEYGLNLGDEVDIIIEMKRKKK